MTAIDRVGLQVGNNKNWWQGNFKGVPSGCSFNNDRRKPLFERSLTGVGKGRRDLTPICRKLDNSGNKNLLLITFWFSAI